MSGHDRITELRIKGLRTLADVRLSLDGLAVLIGENGVGKSSIVEACELLRRLPRETFASEFHSIHEGFRGLLRHGTSSLSFVVVVDGPLGRIEYEVVLAAEREAMVVTREVVVLGDGSSTPRKVLFERVHGQPLELRVPGKLFSLLPLRSLPPDRLAIGAFGLAPPHPAFTRLHAALEAIEVHLPFQTLPRWATDNRRSPLRDSVLLEPASRVKRFGTNLPNVFHALKNEKPDAHWRQTMDYVRLGLGEDVESINTRADPSGGAVALLLKRRNVDEQEPAFLLSEGQLAYLAFVALYRLEAPTSLLVFDEPELHLHPQLMARVLGFFEDMAKRTSVLLATHSDRLLDGLESPAEAARLCELDEQRATRILRPDPESLTEWLRDYRGLGDVRSAGYERIVFTQEEKP